MQPTSNPRSRVLSRLLLLGLGLGLGAGVAACGDGDGDGGVPPALKADLQVVLDDAVANRVTAGATLHVVAGDGDGWSTAAGVAEVERGTAMVPDARFRAGSIMKTFVATAVLQAAEVGRLALDDVLTAHLPVAVTRRIPGAETIEIGMLLAHRSGIPEWETEDVDREIMADPAHVWTLDEILDRAARHPPEFAPGAGYSYSNTNYILLGEILSGLHGRSWRAVVRDQVIAAAGLEHTTLPEPGDRTCAEPCAHGYIPIDGQLLDFSGVDPSMAGASGGHALLTTAADLARFLQALRDGALFANPTTVETMFAFQAAVDASSAQTGYGLGVMRIESNGVTAIGHLGGTAGYQAYMLYFPATDRYVSGVVNVSGALGPVLVPVADRVATP